MGIVLGGLLENAMIRKFDAEKNPSRNKTDHPYYISLNRDVSSAVRSRSDTFLTIADAISIPKVDWNPAYENDSSLSFVKAVDVLSDKEVSALAEVLIGSHALTAETFKAISDVDTSSAKSKGLAIDLRRNAALMYVERLLLQVSLAGKSQQILALSEIEINALSEIGKFILLHKIPTPFEIPDLSSTAVVNADALGVITDFAAIDLAQLNSVRNDSIIREYATEVMKVLSSTSIENTERDLLNAMRHARRNMNILGRYKMCFEVFSLVTKPLQYIPEISTGVAIANDHIHFFEKWIKRKSTHVDWHLIGARMQQIKIEEYLNRKDNVF